jgi:transposase InsO family protein
VFWHCLLGHLDVKGLQVATSGLPVDSVHVKNCRVCALANIKRKRFKRKARNRADKLLWRIHIDICGPFPTGYGRFNYFIVFVDNSSRYYVINFLKLKSEALKAFIEFRLAAEKYLGEEIAVLRVDNAGELIEGEFEVYCRENGITYEKTTPDASQQNGVAERTNQITENMIRAMLVDADLPYYFWPLAAQTAAHIKNRVPHASLPSDKTPFELWMKRKPNLSHLRPFGSLVTARKGNSDSLNKVIARGEEGRFVGYARDSCSYLVWIKDRRVIRPRRNVTFHGFPKKFSVKDGDVVWQELPLPMEPRFLDRGNRILIEHESVAEGPAVAPSSEDTGSLTKDLVIPDKYAPFKSLGSFL